MKALGADIIHTKREDGMLGAAAKAQELLSEIKDSISLQQFKTCQILKLIMRLQDLRFIRILMEN